LHAALQALAKLHQRWAELPVEYVNSLAPPPTILRRLARLEALLTAGERAIRRELETYTPTSTLPGLALRAEQLLELFTDLAPATRDQLVRAAPIAVSLQTCLRDVWHDHLLFTGDEISGIVDYGAVGWDSVASDIARLVGSLARDDVDAWRSCLAAYQQIRALSTDELVLVEVCDAANVLLSGMNWLEWLLVDRRQFDRESRILARLDETLARLVHRKHQRRIWYAD
jgi:homoserine kinase type II